MKRWLRIYGKHLAWMIVSYGALWLLLNLLLIKPQKKLIEQYQTEKNALEYDYIKLKNTPGLIGSLEDAVTKAKARTDSFEWLTGVDPNLDFYEYVSGLAEKNGLLLLQMKKLEQAPGEKSDKYLAWDVGFSGSFQNILRFLHEMENGTRYLKIDKMEIKPAESGGSVFTFTILGLKKLE